MSAHAMGVGPTVVDVWLEPGTEKQFMLTVKNTSQETQRYAVAFTGIQLGASVEDLAFTPMPSELVAWFDVESTSFQLIPNESREVAVRIVVPANAASDLHTIGIQIAGEPAADGSVHVQSVFTTLVFLTVGSQVEQGAQLVEFAATTDVDSATPSAFLTSVRNVGEGVLQPTGMISVKNIFGMTVDELLVNPDGDRLVPGQVRTFASAWGERGNQETFVARLREEWRPLRIGVYSATLSLQPWADSEVMTMKERVVIIPWRTVVIGVVGAAGILWLLRTRRNARV